MLKQIINNEEFTSIQEAQAGLTRLLEAGSKKGNFFRVMKNNKPVGVLVPDNIWMSLMEDFEAMSSKKYLDDIKKARRSKKLHSAGDIKTEFNL